MACRFDKDFLCLTHPDRDDGFPHLPAMCEKGQAELEVQLRGDIESLSQEVIRLASRLAEAEGREASLCDFLNTWARESGVLEAGCQEEAKAVANRLWAYLSSRFHEKEA